MRKFLLFVSILLVPTFVFALESGEQKITLDQACQYSDGDHLPFIKDIGGGMEGFYKYQDSIYISLFDTNQPQAFAQVLSYNCKSHTIVAVGPALYGYNENIQYSPRIKMVTSGYILTDDWENVRKQGNYHVSMILDRKTGKVYSIRDNILRQNLSIKRFIKNQNISWSVVGYNSKQLRVQVELPSKKSQIFTMLLTQENIATTATLPSFLISSASSTVSDREALIDRDTTRLALLISMKTQAMLYYADHGYIKGLETCVPYDTMDAIMKKYTGNSFIPPDTISTRCVNGDKKGQLFLMKETQNASGENIVLIGVEGESSTFGNSSVSFGDISINTPLKPGTGKYYYISF